MVRSIVLLSVTLTFMSAIPAFAQWGGYGTSYAQGMARRAARYTQQKARNHARRIMQKRQNAPKQKKVKQTKQQDEAADQTGKDLPTKEQTPGNMSPSSDYPEWPPSDEKALPQATPSGF